MYLCALPCANLPCNSSLASLTESFIAQTAAMATVRTVEYCELVSLGQNELELVYSSYPSLRRQVHAFVESKKAKYAQHNNKIVNKLANPNFRRKRRDSLLLKAIFPGQLTLSPSSFAPAETPAASPTSAPEVPRFKGLDSFKNACGPLSSRASRANPGAMSSRGGAMSNRFSLRSARPDEPEGEKLELES